MRKTLNTLVVLTLSCLATILGVALLTAADPPPINCDDSCRSVTMLRDWWNNPVTYYRYKNPTCAWCVNGGACKIVEFVGNPPPGYPNPNWACFDLPPQKRDDNTTWLNKYYVSTEGAPLCPVGGATSFIQAKDVPITANEFAEIDTHCNMLATSPLN